MGAARRLPLPGCTVTWMPRRVARAVALIVPCLGAFALVAQTTDPSTRLEPGRAIEQPLAGKAQHRYALTLRQNERAEISALQRGLDVVIRVVAPDGKVLGEFDDEARGGREEHAEVVAVAGGNYTLIVSATWPKIASGAYAIRLAGTRDATDDDRARQELRTLRAEYTRVAESNVAAARPLVERALALAERTSGAAPLGIGPLDGYPSRVVP